MSQDFIAAATAAASVCRRLNEMHMLFARLGSNKQVLDLQCKVTAAGKKVASLTFA